MLESRHVFPKLTVMENLQMGAFLRKDKQNIPGEVEALFEIFPRLKERVWQTAGTLSGGEQEMLVMVRADDFQSQTAYSGRAVDGAGAYFHR